MAIHSSILAWIIPWTEKPGGLQSQRVGQTLQGHKESDTTERLTHTHTHTHIYTDVSEASNNPCVSIVSGGLALSSL